MSAEGGSQKGSATLEPGAMVDHYRIIRPLGAGGMAEVYLARDTKLGRKVALKIIQPKKNEKTDAVERFLFEAKVTASFNHPNIITIHSVGETDSGPYLALEYLEGQTLRERIQQERLSTNESIRIAKAIADALQVAHKKDLLHRDLKPENVMLARDGRLRVLDFGLSRLLGTEDFVDAEGIDNDFFKTGIVAGTFASNQKKVKGTPAYMAPEQWRAEELGPKADIWALGLILYEMLAGHHPYHNIGDIKKLAWLVSDESPVPQPSSQDNIPFRLQELLSRCLAKDSGHRPSANELVLDLSVLLVSDKQQNLTDMSPFRGLVPFEEEHSSLYFGREAEVSSFVERLRTEPILPVVGLSGSGKSSFVKAGVIPRLREKSPLIQIQLRPGREPFLNLASRLVQAWQRPNSTISTMGSLAPMGSVTGQTHKKLKNPHDTIGTPQQLAKSLYDRPQLLGLWLSRLSERHRLHVVLFVDQLEELWALPREAQVAKSSINTGQGSQGGVLDRYMRAISTAADDVQLPVRVILTLREEFLSRLMTSGQVREALSRIMVLRKPSQKTLVDILNQSVKAVGYKFEDYLLAHEMVTEVEDSQSVFSLLQFAGQVLWQNRDQQRKVLTRATFEKMDGVTGALVQHADGVLKGLNADETKVARALLLRLVTENKTKRILSHKDLLAGMQIEAEQVLNRLVESRLVIISRRKEDEEGDCELVHEALISGWDRLNRWIDESSEELRLLNQLEQAARLWDKRGRRIDDLWSKQALEESAIVIEQAISQGPINANFIATSEGNIRKGRLRLTAIFGLFIVALVTSAWIGNHLLRGKLCTGAEEKIASVWNQQVRHEISKSFLGTGVSYPKDTFVRAAKILDTYTNGWRIHYTKACEATHVRGEQSEEVLDLRMGCLRKRMEEFGALLNVFTDADSAVVQKAVQASTSLGLISQCADQEALRAPYPPPRTAQGRARVATIRDALTKVEAYARTGKYRQGLDLAKKLESNTQEIDYRPVQAELWYQLGSLQDKVGDYSIAEITLRKAVKAAGEIGDSLLAAKIMAALVWNVGFRQARYAEGMSIAQDGEVILGLGNNDGITRAQFFQYIGVIYYSQNKYDKALTYFRKALPIKRKLLGPDHPEVATLLNGLGLVFSSLGLADETLQAFHEALDISERALGPENPTTAVLLSNIGREFQSREEFDKAAEYLHRSLTIDEKVLGPGHPELAHTLYQLGVVYWKTGQTEKALDYYHKALALWEKTLGSSHPYLAMPLDSLGLLFMKQGLVNKALPHFERALAVREEKLGNNHPELVESLSGIGSAFVKIGKIEQGLTKLERAMALCKSANCPPRGMFVLARALVATKRDRERAINLAFQARDLFGRKPKSYQAELQEVNIWLHKHAADKQPKKAQQ